MTTTLSVRIDSDTKNQLEALAKRARRSKSFLAAEAIAAYVEAESWQLDEVQAGLQELDQGRAVAHGDVRSEEHTSELQSHLNIVCRLLLGKRYRQKTIGVEPTRQDT